MSSPSQAAFQGLAARAEAGELHLEPNAAQQAAQLCQERIDWLIEFKGLSNTLARASSFGYFGSAQALGKKFEQLAFGAPGSFEDVIQGHIDAVTAMKDAFEKAGAAYQASDQAGSTAINQTGQNLT